MPRSRTRAFAEFKRTIIWIAILGVIAVGGAVGYLWLSGPISANMVIATVLGVFFSVLLGSGLFAAAFYSDKSGYDQDVGGKVDNKSGGINNRPNDTE